MEDGDHAPLGESIAVLCAMSTEARPLVRRLGLPSLREHPDHPHGATRGLVGDRRVSVVVTGIGTAPAARSTRAVLGEDPPDEVLVVGVCGGIHDDLDVGDLVSPRTVLDDRGSELHPRPLPGLDPRGRLLTSDVLHVRPDQIRDLRRRGIDAVDMETAAIGGVCVSRGVAWSVIRAVSDRAGTLPWEPEGETLGIVGPDGTPNPRAAIRHLARRPGRVVPTIRLARGFRSGLRTAVDTAATALQGSGAPGR